MKRILKLSALLVMSLVLGACAPSSVVIKDVPLQPGEYARIDTAVAADGIEGEYAQLARIQVRQPNGAVADSTAMFNGRTQAGQIANTAVGALGPALINAAAGIAIADKQSCGGNGCGGGTQINVAGGTSVAQSESLADTRVHVNTGSNRLCANIAPDGSCM